MQPFFPWLRQVGKPPRFGLVPNWFQAATVMILTVMVGAVLQIVKLATVDAAGREFKQRSYGAKVAYLLPFGLCKAVANLAVGYGADRVGRKPMESLGWALGLAVPVLLGASAARASYAATVLANGFLGAHQGLAWSAAIFVSVDIMGPMRRGLAVGLNETVGYTSVALVARVYSYLERRVVCSWAQATGQDGDLAAALSPECLSASQGACDTPDSWRSECTGWCLCSGYMSLAAAASGVLMAAGLLVSLGLLRETLHSHVLHEANLTAGRDFSQELQRAAVRLPSKAGRYAPRRLTAALQQGHEEEMDEAATASARLLARWEPGAATQGAGDSAAAAPDLDGSVASPREAEIEMCTKTGGTGDDEVRESSRPRGCSSSGELGRGQGPPPQLLRSSCNRSMQVMCVAGFVVNCTAGLAWGLLLAWARDGLGMDGQQRNFAAACYDMLKGLSQFLAGLLSDNVGRKWPVVTGLLGISAGLLTSAFGMGFRGAFLPSGSEDAISDLAFGYLVVAAMLMGVGSGLAYPVMIAAVADHSSPACRAKHMGIYRFWRDLGYAGGALLGGLSDAASPEVVFCSTAALVFASGVAVANFYREEGAVRARGSAPGSEVSQ